RQARDAADGLGQAAHQCDPPEQASDREKNRQQHIKRGEAGFAALIEQGHVEREGREGGVAAKNSGGEKQLPVLRHASPERKKSRKQAHRNGAAHVLEQGGIRKPRPCQADKGKIKSMPQCGANSAANKYDQEAHRSNSFHLRANKNRPAADRFLPPCCTVGVISPFRAVRGGPHPHRGANYRPRNAGSTMARQTSRCESTSVRTVLTKPPPPRRRRRAFDWSTAVIAILALTAAVTVYVRDGRGHFVEVLGGDISLFGEMLPKVLAGCLIGAFVTLLLPREMVARWVGHESGFTGLLIAAFFGFLLPGGPITIYPVAGAFLVMGADAGAV